LNVLPVETVVYHRHHHPVSFVPMAAWVSIAALVIPILVVPLNVLLVETVVWDHPLLYHHPVPNVVMVWWVSTAVLVIPVLRAPAVIPVTTVVPEKNATKNASSPAAAVTVVRVVKEEKVEKVDTTVALAAMEERVGKEERVERVDTTVDTKFVNSSVKLCTRLYNTM